MKHSSLSGGESTLSMRVRPPSEVNAASVAGIRERKSGYTELVGDVDKLLARRVYKSEQPGYEVAGEITVGDSPNGAGPRPPEEGANGAGPSSPKKMAAREKDMPQRRLDERDDAEGGGGEDGTMKNSQSNI